MMLLTLPADVYFDWSGERLEVERQIGGSPGRPDRLGRLQTALRRHQVELFLRQRGARLQHVGDRRQPDAIAALSSVQTLRARSTAAFSAATMRWSPCR